MLDLWQFLQSARALVSIAFLFILFDCRVLVLVEGVNANNESMEPHSVRGLQSKNKRNHITRKMKLKVGKNLTIQSNESSIVVPAPIGDLLPTVILTAAPTSNSSSALAPFQESNGIQGNPSSFMAHSMNSSLTLPIPQENLTLVNLSSHSALSYNSTSMFFVQSMSSSQEAKPLDFATSDINPSFVNSTQMYFESVEKIPKRFFIKTKGRKKNKIVSDTKKSRGKIIHELNELELIVVSFDNATDVSLFKAQGYDASVMEPDPPRFLASHSQHRKLGQNIPNGLWMVYQNVIPLANPPVTQQLCIIDSGLDLTHEDLQGISVTSADGGNVAYDGCSHGTHVTGTIVANANGFGSLGVYPGAKILLIKVWSGSNCGWTYASSIAAAANACYQKGAKVVTFSGGGGSYSSSEESAFSNLSQKGVLIFVAAGNSGNNQYSYPASYPSVISVAATDNNYNRASFSQYNNQVDISAPGVDVWSTVYRGYAYYSGTSMACPFASGITFRLWNEFPTYTSNDIKSAILNMATDLGQYGRDDTFGNGFIRYWGAFSYLTWLGSPTWQLFKLCRDYPCSSDDKQNFFFKGSADWSVMPPPIGNDALSFVYIPAGWTFQYFEHADFGGITRVFGGYDYNTNLWMGGHNDFVSSFKIRKFPNSEQVMLCKDNPCGSGGRYYARAGNWASMPAEIGNDQLSFVYIPSGYVFWYFEHANYDGWNGQVSGPVYLSMGGYNDAVSSFVIFLL